MKILKGIIKFLPVIILATLMIKEFDALIAAPIATIAALVIAIFMEKHSFKDCIDTAMKSVSNILIALFILMFAYAMASAFMTTGVGAAVVNIALSAGVTARSIAVVGICVTAVLSVATGTSWGTMAACAPMFWGQHRSYLGYYNSIFRYPGSRGSRQNKNPRCMVNSLFGSCSDHILHCRICSA